MRNDPSLAVKIYDRTKAIFQRDVIVTDTTGKLLVAPSDITQTLWPEARQAAEQQEMVHGSDQLTWFPLLYEDRSFGALGIFTAENKLSAETVSLLQGLAEVLAHQHWLIERVQSPAAIRSEFIRELLDGQVTVEEASKQADILQINIEPPQAVMMVHRPGFELGASSQADLSSEEQQVERDRAVEQLTENLMERFADRHNAIGYLGEDTFVILKGIEDATAKPPRIANQLVSAAGQIKELLLKTQQKSSVTIGIGQYYPDLGGLRKSYQEAKWALDVGTKVWGPDQIYHITRVGMFISLAPISQERKAELAHQLLYPLLRDHQLYKTVRAFLESGLNLSAAATGLHIHRNTLIYRLNKTKKLIGLDPRHFEDALQIKLGLMFYQ